MKNTKKGLKEKKQEKENEFTPEQEKIRAWAKEWNRKQLEKKNNDNT